MIGREWKRFRQFLPFLMELVKRDFKAKYKRSSLGVLWSVLEPLVMMTVMVIVFSKLIGINVQHFPAYLISGHTIFGLFSSSTSMSMNSIAGGGVFVSRVNVPLYMLPISKVLSCMVTMGVTMIPMIIVFVSIKLPLSWTMLLFPIPILYTFIFCCGISIFLSAATVFFRDLTHLYGILTTIIMYLSCIFYTEDIIPEQFSFLVRYNPIYGFIKMFRNVMLYNTFPSINDHIACIMFCFLSLVLGIGFFNRTKTRFLLRL